MVDFQNVVSGSYVPTEEGAVVSIGPLPGSTPATPAPLECYVAQLGNFGSGGPVSKAQVQRIQGGPWVDVAVSSINTNGSVTFRCYGVAVRYLIPTLTSPGTGATAPRVVFKCRNLLLPSFGNRTEARVSSHVFLDDAGTTAEVGSLPGYSLSNPDSPPLGTPYKSLVFLTQVGAGTSFIESTYRDGDGTFKVKEGGTNSGVDGQVCIESYAEEHHIDFTDGTGTTDLWLDVFQVPV